MLSLFDEGGAENKTFMFLCRVNAGIVVEQS
jgi:hypothetical protein